MVAYLIITLISKMYENEKGMSVLKMRNYSKNLGWRKQWLQEEEQKVN